MPGKPEGGPVAEAGESLGFTLSQLGFATSRRFGELVGMLGLEPRHFALLRTVRRHDGRSQQEVAEHLHIPASTMVALVDHLEQEGLLERRFHASDRRTRSLHLTVQGGAVLDKALTLATDWEEAIGAGLSPAERAQLLTLLGRV